MQKAETRLEDESRVAKLTNLNESERRASERARTGRERGHGKQDTTRQDKTRQDENRNRQQAGWGGWFGIA